MNKLPVLIYSSMSDPVSKILVNDCRFDAIHVDELLPFFGTAKEIISSAVSGSLPGSVVDRFKGRFIVNRVFGFENTKVESSFSALGMSSSWGHAIVAALLNHGSGFTHKQGPLGISPCQLPLHLQWLRVSGCGFNIRTPKFKYLFGYADVDLVDSGEWMQKSIWSYSDWREEGKILDHERKRNKFLVEKPGGCPIVCYYFGKNSKFMYPYGTIDEKNIPNKELIESIKNIFSSDIGEILFYITESGSCRFQAFSPHMITSCECPDFIGMMKSYIKNCCDNNGGVTVSK